MKIDLGQGPRPHAEGGFVTPTGKLGLRADWLADAGLDPLPFYDPPAEVADAALAERFPLALVTPKTHLFLNSTFANQSASTARSPSPTSSSSRTTPPRAGSPTAGACASSTTAARSASRRSVSDAARPGVLVAPMGWWSARLRRRPQQPGDDVRSA